MNWFRWHHGTVTDPKMALIAQKSGQPISLVLSVWAYLLEIGSQAVPRGDISSFDSESLAVTLVTVTSHIDKIVSAMYEKNMLLDGKIGKWNIRQCDPTAAERQRKCRENKRFEKRDIVTVTPVTVTTVTSRNVTPEEIIINNTYREIKLPDWMPTIPWQAFIEMRKKIKKPMTDYALGLKIKALEKFKNEGHDPEAVLNQSIANSWNDLYPLKTNSVPAQNEQRYF